VTRGYAYINERWRGLQNVTFFENIRIYFQCFKNLINPNVTLWANLDQNVSLGVNIIVKISKFGVAVPLTTFYR